MLVPYGELALLPAVVNTAEVLAESGFDVTVVAVDTRRFAGVPMHQFTAHCIRLIQPVPGTLGRFRGLAWIEAIRLLTRTAVRAARGRQFDIVIGVDADGVIAARQVTRLLGAAPVVYFSLELELARGEVSHFWKGLREKRSPPGVLLRRFARNRLLAVTRKRWERRAHCSSALTVALEPSRARALIDDNGVPDAEVMIVPTSPRALSRTPDRQFLRERLGLQGRRILLQLGGISDVALSLELARAARAWPADWALVLHGFASDAGYLSRVRAEAEPGRVFVSTDLLPYAQLDDLVASGDIGLAFWRPVDLNYLNMASGKLWQYLKCGVPVVTSDFPVLQDLVSRTGCGLAVAGPELVQAAAERVFADHAQYANAAKRYFAAEGDFTVHARRLAARLADLVGAC
jgi:hypothetical protein